MRRAAQFLVFALALGSAESHAAIPEFARTREWIELRGRTLTVITDAGLGAGRDVAERLERFSATLGQLNPGLRSLSASPTSVIVFRSQDELERYRPTASENLVAYFTAAEDGNWLVMNGRPEGFQRSHVVFHEFVHCYLTANFPAVPLWLHEGLAEYYSTCRFKGRSSAEFGTPNQEMLDWVKGHPPISMDLMFAMKPEAAAYRGDNSLRNQFYAQAFTLTHFLQSTSGGRAERFDRFLARLHEGTSPLNAFRESFPRTEWDALVGGLAAHLERIPFEPTRRVELPASFQPAGFTERAIPASEALTRLGELLLLLGEDRVGQATEHFDAALILDSGNAHALAARGLAADRAGQAAEAESFYRRALAAAPGDSRVTNLAGRGAIVRFAKQSEAVPRESLQVIARLAQERFLRSLRLDPDDLEAMGEIGKTYVALEETPDSATIRGLERAVDALPVRSDFARALLVLKARQGRSAEAEHLLRHRVAPIATRSETQAALDFVRAADLERAIQWMNAKEFGKAESLLVLIEANAPDPSMRSAARERLDAIHDSRRYDALSLQFAEAALLADRGNLETARTRFAAVRDSAPANATELREKADENVRELEARIQGERARALMKAGKPVEARNALAKILLMNVSEEAKSWARDRIKEIDAALGKR